MSNCDQRKLLKEIQQMLNKALEEVKDISKRMKALDESNMAMKEELSRLQEGLKNITEEELLSLDSMKLEEQIKFQKSTAAITSRDVDLCVKVDDDINIHVALEVQLKEPTKKASIQDSMIQELAIQVSVIQESKIQEPTILMVSESNEVLRIQEHFKVQRINETLKIEEPLKA
ncbi:hypothetical protein SO802_030355 [Lithocarpus litseifolius]|uniref:Uncharacterized protein n=1 Tax=Lithocarpus litseifolius TaxID=425828 RepID=A0AAW2BHD2_9ROSI